MSYHIEEMNLTTGGKMVKLKEKKLITEDGREIAVQIDMESYRELEEYIEDLEDSIILAEAIKKAKGFRLWEDFVAELNGLRE